MAKTVNVCIARVLAKKPIDNEAVFVNDVMVMPGPACLREVLCA